MTIESLSVRMGVVGAIAETEITARFLNPSRDRLEGTFALDLPPQAVVMGYALDVNDAMVDGVLVGRGKARREYTERVRRDIDPGLAEVSRARPEWRLRPRTHPRFWPHTTS